jgi:hypothetical protein
VGNAARFNTPFALWGDGTYLYVAERSAPPDIRRVNIATREVSTFAADIGYPGGIWGDGRYLYYTVTKTRTLERISMSTGERSRFAGDTCTEVICGPADGVGTAARFWDRRSDLGRCCKPILE